ncbi:disulfide reductase [archaeon]|nr:MAG: disulfide reductase [archaeon]RLG64211.1 MAG: disulfide reductase [archaeon]HDM23350.1 CoB--CoM heterodisulfide reductase iron-sulfur subunit A family protein [Candidatus Bathyarchaeota archaeon]
MAVRERVGVFVCHCGRNIAATVDVKKVVEEISKHPYVVHAEDYKYMCSDPGQKLIYDAIKSKKLTAVVVAACSPTMHEETFRKVCEEAGLNRYKCEIANIREQCSWVHTDIEKATEKAIRIIRGAIEKVVKNRPLHKIELDIVRKCLVIGGGIAGIQAALDIANAGIPVILVEKSPTIGGHMAQLSETFPTLDCSQCILTPKMVEVARHPLIKLYTCSEVIEVSGYVGNFRVKILKRPRYVDEYKCTMCGDCADVCPVLVLNEFDRGLSLRKAIYIPFPQAVPAAYVIDPESCLGFNPIKCGKCKDVCEQEAIDFDMKEEIIEEEVGAIIVATGYGLYPKEKIGEYGYGRYEDVIDSLEFERLLSSTGPTGGEIRRPSDGKIPKRIAFIQCVGSRDENHLPYCSKICCMYTAKHAMLYKHRVPDGEAYVFYIDIRAAGKGYEEFIKRVQEEYGITYIRGRVSKIYEENGKLIVHGVDTLTGVPVKLEVDMVVLAMGMIPTGSIELAKKLKIPIDQYGFLQEVHPKLRPVESVSDGIYICGCAQGPKDISETVTQASAAASKAISLLTRPKLYREPLVAEVNEEICSGCGVCASICPYSAIEIVEGVARVNEILCAGCGTCSAACPSGAMQLRNIEDKTVLRMIKSMLG